MSFALIKARLFLEDLEDRDSIRCQDRGVLEGKLWRFVSLILEKCETSVGNFGFNFRIFWIINRDFDIKATDIWRDGREYWPLSIKTSVLHWCRFIEKVPIHVIFRILTSCLLVVILYQSQLVGTNGEVTEERRVIRRCKESLVGALCCMNVRLCAWISREVGLMALKLVFLHQRQLPGLSTKVFRNMVYRLNDWTPFRKCRELVTTTRIWLLWSHVRLRRRFCLITSQTILSTKAWLRKNFIFLVFWLQIQCLQGWWCYWLNLFTADTAELWNVCWDQFCMVEIPRLIKVKILSVVSLNQATRRKLETMKVFRWVQGYTTEVPGEIFGKQDWSIQFLARKEEVFKRVWYSGLICSLKWGDGDRWDFGPICLYRTR
ncbi:unnamed protein product [Eruca vesicaria subsp. sativa]|uniref:Uncharacterized protein n=1 Tax=Eruca vesicaria subsp. sativa TaxID=29727 RepID=A0ABC8LC08_ERUVS|nr:unnamed protein product [Eruca vesicaria subsp. sativa]